MLLSQVRPLKPALSPPFCCDGDPRHFLTNAILVIKHLETIAVYGSCQSIIGRVTPMKWLAC